MELCVLKEQKLVLSGRLLSSCASCYLLSSENSTEGLADGLQKRISLILVCLTKLDTQCTTELYEFHKPNSCISMKQP